MLCIKLEILCLFSYPLPLKLNLRNSRNIFFLADISPITLRLPKFKQTTIVIVIITINNIILLLLFFFFLKTGMDLVHIEKDQKPWVAIQKGCSEPY